MQKHQCLKYKNPTKISEVGLRSLWQRCLFFAGHPARAICTRKDDYLVTYTFKLRLDSPAFLNGSDSKGSPEFRAPSFRGQFRYWARAIVGAHSSDLKQLWEKESAAFGSTGQGAPVMVRVTPLFTNKTGQEPMLPHREFGGGKVSPALAIREETPFTLMCQTRPAVKMPELVDQALAVWLLLGGVGKRSRRMFGSPGLRGASGVEESNLLAWAAQPIQSPDELQNRVQQLLSQIIGDGGPLHSIPSFPTLHPRFSRVVVGGDDLGSAKDANQKVFGLLRGKYKQYGDDYFGRAMGGRRASPLIAQVRRLGDGYYPVLTYMVSKPMKPDLSVVNRFMNDAEKEFGGKTVWGGEFK